MWTLLLEEGNKSVVVIFAVADAVAGGCSDVISNLRPLLLLVPSRCLQLIGMISMLWALLLEEGDLEDS